MYYIYCILVVIEPSKRRKAGISASERSLHDFHFMLERKNPSSEACFSPLDNP